MDKAELEQLAQDWVAVVTRPAVFWENMVALGYGRPFKFLGTCLVLPWIITSLSGLVWAITHGLPLGLYIGGNLISLFFLSCFAGLNFLSALAMWAVGEKMGSTADTEHCFWVTAFASAPAVLTFVPVLGWIFFLYAFVLLYLGIRRIHQLSEAKSILLLAVVVAVHLLPALVMGLLAGSAMIGIQKLMGGS